MFFVALQSVNMLVVDAIFFRYDKNPFGHVSQDVAYLSHSVGLKRGLVSAALVRV